MKTVLDYVISAETQKKIFQQNKKQIITRSLPISATLHTIEIRSTTGCLSGHSEIQV